MKGLGSQIREARQRRHLSQSALARLAGCKQSALSMYEGGRTTALGAQAVARICEELGLVAPGEGELAQAPSPSVGERVFCPNAACPSNLAVALGEGRVALVPRGHVAGADEVHCAWCGEVLERACPECGAPLNAGAFCARCGAAYLAEAPERVDPAREAAMARAFEWAR